MTEANARNFHDRFCANRTVKTAGFFVACCATALLSSWGALGRSRPVDSSAFFVFFQIYILFVIGVLFTVFKCLRERVVLGLALLPPIRVLSFRAAPSLRTLAGLVGQFDFVVSLVALVVSVSMLISALRSRVRQG